MPYDLLVEVSGEFDPELRDRLLSLAYRASRSREVALVLRGVSRQAVDRTLDPIVEREGTAVAGIRYLEPEEAESLLRQRAVRRCLVLSRDADWIPGLNGASPLVRTPEEGIALLEEALLAGGLDPPSNVSSDPVP